MLPLVLLQCPACRGALTADSDALTCAGCAARYPIQGGIPVFVPEARQQTVVQHQKKSALRRAFRLLQPPHHSLTFGTFKPSYREGPELISFLRDVPRDRVILNVGSLSMDLKVLHPSILNLDISWYPNIDVVGDAHRLPFKDASVDVLLFKNVLEHIRDPALALSEIRRVLKPGGVLYLKVPFLQPFHAVPDDYQRYTVSGFKELMERDYEETAFGVAVGPASMLCWMLREYLAVLTSFGSMRAYQLGIAVWGWLTFWVKYADVLFWSNPLSDRVTSAFYAFERKR